jgi:site-specific DNA-cytosine methylase
VPINETSVINIVKSHPSSYDSWLDSYYTRWNGKHKMKAIDLFCGAGGLTVGLKMAGFDVISAIEKEAIVSETYNFNHPDVNLITGDIRSISPVELMAQLKIQQGELDLLAGCPPCQGFSSLRTKIKLRPSLMNEMNSYLIFRLCKSIFT